MSGLVDTVMEAVQWACRIFAWQDLKMSCSGDVYEVGEVRAEIHHMQRFLIHSAFML